MEYCVCRTTLVLPDMLNSWCGSKICVKKIVKLAILLYCRLSCIAVQCSAVQWTKTKDRALVCFLLQVAPPPEVFQSHFKGSSAVQEKLNCKRRTRAREGQRNIVEYLANGKNCKSLTGCVNTKTTCRLKDIPLIGSIRQEVNWVRNASHIELAWNILIFVPNCIQL